MNIRDEERREAWDAVETRIGGALGKEITDKIARLYSLYDRDMLKWFAELYDPKIGGFYCTVPARDTDGYLPDIESTYAVLAAFHSMGMIKKYGSNFANATPAWLNNKVGEFILSCQDEDGYFYQPQWGKDVSILRKSRDLTSAAYLLDCIGIKPRYPLPMIGKGDGESSFDLSNAPERFRSADNFRAYLEAQDLSKTSYHTGSELLSQFKEIEAYSKMLGVDLVSEIIAWLNKYKRADNGLWQEEIDYHATNGLHKLAWVYNLADAPIPHLLACANSTLKIIMSDIPTKQNVDVYNPWHVLGELVKNVKKHDKAQYDSLTALIYSKASEAIEKTIEKISVYKRPDGSLSYRRDGLDCTSQGSPSSPNGIPCSSINGTCCGSISLTSSVFKAFDIDDIRVPLYTEKDFDYFIEMIEKVNSKDKE